MIENTTYLTGSATLDYAGHRKIRCPDELLARYQRLLDSQRLNWTEHHKFLKLLGSGGQAKSYYFS